jgi:glycosyltransferase involved in cell wall biosynthesis
LDNERGKLTRLIFFLKNCNETSSLPSIPFYEFESAVNNNKVSIITALHNKGGYVRDTIASVLSQTIDNWELIVVENHSTDDGPEQVRALGDPRISLIVGGAEIRGPGAARNLGIDYANGDWVLFLDADDLIAADHLQRLLETANSNPQSSVVAGGWQEWVDGSEPTATTIKRPASERQPANLSDSSICHPPWAIHAAILKRNLLDRVRWDVTLDSFLGEDICFWFQLCSCAQVAFSESATAIYRTQTENCRTERFNIVAWFEGIHAATEKNLNFIAERGDDVTDAQCEMLVRCYEDLYSQARKQGDSKYAKIALNLSKEWLEERCRHRSRLTKTIRWRRRLGIPFYQWARARYLSLRLPVFAHFWRVQNSVILSEKRTKNLSLSSRKVRLRDRFSRGEILQSPGLLQDDSCSQKSVVKQMRSAEYPHPNSLPEGEGTNTLTYLQIISGNIYRNY